MDDNVFVSILDRASCNEDAAKRQGSATCVGCLKTVPAKYIDYDDGHCNCPLCGFDVMLVGVSEDVVREVAQKLKGV